MTAGPLAGRGAVVTGGGRGIGRAIARTLAASGAAVVTASRTAAEAEATAAEIRDAGGVAHAVPADVTSEESVAALAEAASARLGVVDILALSAGEAASAPYHRISLDEWNAMLAVHATGTFLCTRAFAPAMAERGFGRIVCVASVAGLEGGKYIAHYAAAKHAVLGFVRSVALELGGRGVTVNAVCPGYVDTAMTERTLETVQARAGLDREHALSAVLATVGQERLITPEEVADAVRSLCLPDSGGVTGQAIVLPMKVAS